MHPDMKGHGGMFVTMGTGAMLSKSAKLKCNTLSSTETEVVATGQLLQQLGFVTSALRKANQLKRTSYSKTMKAYKTTEELSLLNRGCKQTYRCKIFFCL